jgi:magnesium chelatase family protein
MLARVTSATVIGVKAAPIDVEVDVAVGLPGCHIVGLPDAGVREGRVRIRGALENSGFKLPPRRITVNLAPADLRKDGAAFDLPIAIGILCASGQVDPAALEDTLFVGELALDGSLRAVRGVLPIAAWARRRSLRRVVVPPDNAGEAAVVGGCEISTARDLAELVALLRGGGEAEAAPNMTTATTTTTTAATSPAPSSDDAPDLAEVRGQEVPRRALEIAAAGGHNLLFVGPPGAGKTMLAQRLPGILPALTFEEALETSMVYSIAGLLDGGAALVRARPFRAPHHTVTAPGLVGGGALLRPGEITLAHNGVLFLDELLEFPRQALEALRQPLESRVVSLVRARRAVVYPADFMLIAALNPCPCGHLGGGVRSCTCSLAAVAAYRARLSGPLLDRIDLHVEVPALPYRELAAAPAGEASASVRARVEQARQRQRKRVDGARAARWNARLGARALESAAPLDSDGHALLERAVARFGLSARAITRVRRVARTIADLDGSATVRTPHVAEALQYRVLDRAIETTIH